MKAYLINMHLLVTRSRSSAKVKVKYKDYISQKNGLFGSIVFHKYILFFMETYEICRVFRWILDKNEVNSSKSFFSREINAVEYRLKVNHSYTCC